MYPFKDTEFAIKNKIKKLLTELRKTCWIVINRKKGKRHYVLIKYANKLMYNRTLYHGEKNIFTVIVYKLSVQKKY